ELKNLASLSIWGSRVTDDGVKELKHLKNLTYLNLWATFVTDAGVKELQELLPQCDIRKPPDPMPAPPADAKIAAAVRAFAKHEAEFRAVYDPRTKKTRPYFVMPPETTDAELKGLPDPPFEFALHLSFTKVTDAGLTELKGLNNLTALHLH